jgi:hypothetical protein
MRSRLRGGWQSKGRHGYHGYAWRKHFEQVELDIWCHQDATGADSLSDVEAVEAEVVFLIRAAGQWPEHQTEIHFHQSTERHREVARAIMEHYKRPQPA